MLSLYSPSDVRRGYRWLGHAGHGVTEVSVLHPEYHAGDVAWNRAHHSFPITAYLTSEAELLGLVRQYAGERMVCYSINPRQSILMHEDGRVRSAKEADIAVSQSVAFDIDLEGTPSPSRLASVTRFLSVADQYFQSLGLQRPVRASSGNRGSHLLFAYPPILTREIPDVGDRLRSFRARFVSAVWQDLDRLEARVDSGTLALRAMLKVYGSSKPGGAISKFYGKERVEDQALREYLLRLTVPVVSASITVPVRIGDVLPEWFTGLLARDDRLRSLYEGNGKTADTDRSVSGYDFSVVRHLAQLGFRDPNELGTILSLRPAGFAERCTKGQSYVERTVSRALRVRA